MTKSPTMEFVPIHAPNGLTLAFFISVSLQSSQRIFPDVSWYPVADKDGISFKFHKDSGFAKATYIMCGSRGVRIDRQIGANSKFKNSGTVVISRLDDEEMDPVLLIVDGVENFIRERKQ